MPTINTVFKRDPDTKSKTLLDEYSEPEFEFLQDCQWRCTEKVDGTNIRVMWNGESVVFGGKSDNAQIPVSLLYKLQELFEGTVKKQVFQNTFGDGETQICLYGEGYGPKIQKGGGNYCSACSFVLFDVKIGGVWLQWASLIDIAEKLSIDLVPVKAECSLDYAVAITRDGFKSVWGDFIAEGLVMKPVVDLQTRLGKRIITKIKHKDFAKGPDK